MIILSMLMHKMTMTSKSGVYLTDYSLIVSSTSFCKLFNSRLIDFYHKFILMRDLVGKLFTYPMYLCRYIWKKNIKIEQ